MAKGDSIIETFYICETRSGAYRSLLEWRDKLIGKTLKHKHGQFKILSVDSEKENVVSGQCVYEANVKTQKID